MADLDRRVIGLLRRRRYNNALLTMAQAMQGTGAPASTLAPILSRVAVFVRSECAGAGGGHRYGWRIRERFRDEYPAAEGGR